MDIQHQIYEELNKFTDQGIEHFLENSIAEKYTGEPYSDFIFEAVGDKNLMIGFYLESNGDLVPDPIYSITMGKKKAMVTGTETQLGYFSANSEYPGTTFEREKSDKDFLEFMQEMSKRKAKGIMKRVKRINALTGVEL